MSIVGFEYKDPSIGTDDTTEYTFDFKIFDPTHIHFYLQDNLGNILAEFDGTDTTNLSSFTFDSVNGGGTYTLINPLQTDYVITPFIADDAPDQPNSFLNLGSLTMSAIEGAFDYLAAWGQRAAFLAQRAVRLHDLDDIDGFDMRLPFGLANNPDCSVIVNDAGDGWEIGPNLSTIAGAVGSAAAAATSATASAASAAASAASAAAAAASASLANLGFFVQAAVTRAAPLLITAAGGITPAQKPRELQFVKGSPGAVSITSVAAGTTLGQELLLVGTSDTNTVTIPNGSGTKQNGDMILGDNDTICYIWDGANWTEIYRSQTA